MIFSLSNPISAMEPPEEELRTTRRKSPSDLENNTDTTYLEFLKTSRRNWKIAGHVFETTENIFDAIAYGGVLFSQIMPESAKTYFTYGMVILGTGKLICIKFRDVAKKSAKARDEELTELKRAN